MAEKDCGSMHWAKNGELMRKTDLDNNISGAADSKRNFILFTIAIFASFAVFGLSDMIRGTVLPRIQADFSLTELHLGIMLAVSSSGYLLTCTLTAALARRIGIKSCHILGLALIVVSGAAIYLAPNFAAVLLGFFLLNLAFGMLEISVGVIAAKIFTKNTGTMMNLAHFAFGAGAVFAPIISTGIMAARFGDQVLSWRHVYLIALCFAIVPVIPLLLGRLKKGDDGRKKLNHTALLGKPAMWMVGMILFLGVVGEAGIASWFVSYLEVTLGFTGEQSALNMTMYFITFTLARLILGPFIDRIGFMNSLIIATGFAAVMITLGVVFGEGGRVMIILSGVGIAPIFPTVMAVVAKLFSDTIELAMTTIMTMLGVLMIPANILVGGVISQSRVIFTDRYGEAGAAMAFSAGFLIFGIAAFLAFAFALTLRIRQKRLGKLV